MSSKTKDWFGRPVGWFWVNVAKLLEPVSSIYKLLFSRLTITLHARCHCWDSLPGTYGFNTSVPPWMSIQKSQIMLRMVPVSESSLNRWLGPPCFDHVFITVPGVDISLLAPSSNQFISLLIKKYWGTHIVKCVWNVERTTEMTGWMKS